MKCFLFCKNENLKESLRAILQNSLEKVFADEADLFDGYFHNSILILHEQSCDDSIESLLGHLKVAYPYAKFFVLTNLPSVTKGASLLKFEIKGYGNSFMHDALLHQALDVIDSGNIWLYPELTQHLIQNFKTSEKSQVSNALEGLTEHEKECATLTANGNSNKDIAQLMNIQEVTVKKYLSSVYKKLSLKNRVELALLLK